MGSFGYITIRILKRKALFSINGTIVEVIKEHLPKAITLCVPLQEATGGALQGFAPSPRVIGAISGPSRGRDHFWIWKHPTHKGHKSFLRSQIEIELLLRGIEGA